MLSQCDSKEYWDARAKEFGKSFEGWKATLVVGAEKYYNEYVNFLQKRAVLTVLKIKKGIKILDVGCGVGRWVFMFAERGADVIGVDFSKEMIRIAKEKNKKRGYKNAHFLVCSVSHIPFRDAFFDIINSVTTLQHVTDQGVFTNSVKDIVRVCKNMGTIFLLELVTWKRKKSLPHVYLRTSKEWVKIFSDNKCQLVLQKAVEFAFFRRLISNLAYGYYRITHPTSYDSEIFSRVLFYQKSSLRGLYDACMKTAIFLSKPFDRYLSEFRFLRIFSESRVFLFRKMR